jgi:hypothetical protein
MFFLGMCQLGGEPLVCLGAVGLSLVGEHIVCQKEVFLCSVRVVVCVPRQQPWPLKGEVVGMRGACRAVCVVQCTWGVLWGRSCWDFNLLGCKA